MRKARIAAIVLSAAAWGSAWAVDLSLVEAAERGDRQTVLALIEQGADVNAAHPNGTTALHWAVHQNDVDLVRRLIKAGADVRVENDFGATPMSEAAIIGNPEIIKLLLDAGADVESPNREGQTALMAVARTGNVKAAELLIKRGANVNARERWGGQTALMWAAAQKHPEMIRLLIKHGADVNARATVRDWPRKVTAEGRPKDMNRGGFTPLLYAAREGCVPCARELLKGGADIDLHDPDRTTPLVLALMNLHWDFAKFLIEAGADVNKWDLFGQTPLYVAVDMNTLPRGGRPDLPSTDDTTGLEVIELLLKAGANPNIQLKLRPPYRNVPFDRGGDVILSTGATPLLRAARAADIPAMKLLLQYGARVDLPNAQGVTPFMAAAGMGHGSNPTRGRFKTDADAVEAVRLLKEAGADVNRQALNGTTALHAAAQLGWNETIKTLVAFNAELEIPDAKGLRPIDYAAGRYEPAFLAPPPQPLPETIGLLKQFIVAATGREPLEFSGDLSRNRRGTGGNTVAN